MQQSMTHFHSQTAIFFFIRCSFCLHTFLLCLLTFSFVLINYSFCLRCSISLSQFYKNARNKPSIYVTFNGYLPYIQPLNTSLATLKSVCDILVGQGFLLLSIRFFLFIVILFVGVFFLFIVLLDCFGSCLAFVFLM